MGVRLLLYVSAAGGLSLLAYSKIKKISGSGWGRGSMIHQVQKGFLVNIKTGALGELIEFNIEPRLEIVLFVPCLARELGRYVAGRIQQRN